MKTFNKFYSLLIIGAIFTSFIAIKFEIPKPFTSKYLDELYLPLADSTVHINPVPEDQYYKLSTREIYKTYPIYLPGREPKDYYETLQAVQPKVVFNPDELNSEEDWINAGELVFDYSLTMRPLDSAVLSRLTLLYNEKKLPVTPEGIVPFYKLVITQKGRLGITGRSCTMCHIKVMPDGSLIKGAQGNFPFDADFAHDIKNGWQNAVKNNVPKEQIEGFLRGTKNFLFGVPWIKSEAQSRVDSMSINDFVENLDRTYGGVMHRHGTNIGMPASIPDLFNLKERKYLDHTGLMRHRSIEDLMLYATLNEETDFMTKYNDMTILRPWPDEQKDPSRIGSRFSDAQLYALAKYIYSLKTPTNPVKYSKPILDKGKRVFAEQGCVTCHAPPFYSNNTLFPVDGFKFNKDYKERFDIFDISVGTDPLLAVNTRRGTGFYKVPSLIGVWNRQALLHDGSITSLEELLSSDRLEDTYKRTGYNPTWNKSGKVNGHPFGIEISKEDKEALIAFVNSL